MNAKECMALLQSKIADNIVDREEKVMLSKDYGIEHLIHHHQPKSQCRHSIETRGARRQLERKNEESKSFFFSGQFLHSMPLSTERHRHNGNDILPLHFPIPTLQGPGIEYSSCWWVW